MPGPKSLGRTESEGNSVNWNKWISVVPIHSYCRRNAWYIICTRQNMTNDKNLIQQIKIPRRHHEKL